ncbi:hypothetical protein [Comamonas sp. NoAH]|uniref:hypothetical protein n=1 Tax=Comamonas halotolerans TaxID=3041496 RepID=UPI0024E15702|nr:hypothetical protein [Comamonas sp. NoAH]
MLLSLHTWNQRLAVAFRSKPLAGLIGLLLLAWALTRLALVGILLFLLSRTMGLLSRLWLIRALLLLLTRLVGLLAWLPLIRILLLLLLLLRILVHLVLAGLLVHVALMIGLLIHSLLLDGEQRAGVLACVNVETAT